MTRLKAKKDMYIGGVMVLRGYFYSVEDNIARRHIRDGMAEAAPKLKPSVAENRKTKITGGKEKK